MPTLVNTNQTALNSSSQFSIPEIVLTKYPDLVELIKQTESMNLEEKNYWFKIMPMMNDEQIANLRSILVKEKTTLTQINQKYNEDIQNINTEYEDQIKTLERKKQIAQIKEAEQANESEESEEEKALLDELAQL